MDKLKSRNEPHHLDNEESSQDGDRRAGLADTAVDPVHVSGRRHQKENKSERRGDHGRGRDGRDHEPEPALHHHADAASREQRAGRQGDPSESR